ncbi:outer membrane lipoprotein carrier protein LolA [Pedomonas mirosovicensis]|uniref:outer membrane lipoprotein carrier protein LolA n=1 Tax=Pedomonas mirosovicensis TaxID=2908641 RepID=UPI00216AAE6D|nr:outer membrane lipoprotein carrier protein LolA [Pedomonas mirosovicensis]MCH8686366.1 outer membrane lipoprotein carrier protein LolA [Pedomonas mirosovicensis]
MARWVTTMIRALLMAALAVGMPGMAGAETLQGKAALQALTAQVEKAEVLRANFRQVRTTKALSQPLVSEGKLVVAGNRGLLWQLENPFPLMIAITPEKIIEREEGLPARATPTASQPMFGAFTRLFLGLLSSKPEGVAEIFDARLERTGAAWQLRLTPKDALIRRAIAGIDVTGGRFIEKVLVREQSGDATAIDISGHTIRPAALTPAERRAFGG